MKRKMILIILISIVLFAPSFGDNNFYKNYYILDLDKNPSSLLFNHGISNMISFSYDEYGNYSFVFNNAFSKLFGFSYIYNTNIANSLGTFKWETPLLFFKNTLLGLSFNTHLNRNLKTQPYITMAFSQRFNHFILNLIYDNFGNLNVPFSQRIVNGNFSYINKYFMLQFFYQRDLNNFLEKYGFYLNITPKSGLNLFGGYDIANKYFSFGLSTSFDYLYTDYSFNNFNNTFSFTLLQTTKKQKNLLASYKKIKIHIGGKYKFFPQKSLFHRDKSLFNLLKTLDQIEQLNRTKTLFVELTDNNLSYADMYQIRSLLEKIRNNGTNVIIYINEGNIPFKDYYLASIGDQVIAVNAATFFMGGISSTTLYYGNFLRFFRIQPQFIRPDDCIYKSAVEPFTQDHPSESAQEDKNEYMQSVFNEIVKSIKISRGLSDTEIKTIIDNFPILLSYKAKQFKLIDKVMNEDTVNKKFKKFITFDYVEITNSKKEIALVPMDGMILAQGTVSPLMGDTITPNIYRKLFKKIGKNKQIKYVIILLNSPGGDAFSSEKLYQYIHRLKEKGKKVYVYMENVGASGGYYLSSAADKIYVNPFTITGSIGIFAGKFYIEKAYNLLKIKKYTTNMGQRADFMSPFRKWDNEDIKIMKSHLETLYLLFKQRVSTGRNIKIKTVNEIAKGKIYSGYDALKVNLADQVISFNDFLTNIFLSLNKKSIDYSVIKIYYPRVYPFEKIHEIFSFNSLKLLNLNFWTLYMGE